MKRYFILFVICVFLSLVFLSSCRTNHNHFDTTDTSTNHTKHENTNTTYPLTKLKANGVKLTNENGETVQLKGVNLGGWLVFEEWFCPLYDNKDTEPKAAGTEIYDILLSRFSESQVDELIDTYQKNWITEYDLDYLQKIGINCVRVPFWYRNLQTADGSYKLNANGEIDFGCLDWITDECEKRGIYVILDLHGAPGFQNAAHHSGANNNCMLFDKSDEGEAYRIATEDLWIKVAEHFKDNPTIAGYDLLNEPYCDMTLDAKAYENINSMYDRLYNAVRKTDTSTVIIMEGIWRLNNLPNPKDMGWENVMYETHFYDYSSAAISNNIDHLKTYSTLYNVPVYVGEFESGEYEEYAISGYYKAGASITTWTYKGIGEAKQWFLRCNTRYSSVANIQVDSFEVILNKWGNSITTKKGFKVNVSIENALKEQ